MTSIASAGLTTDINLIASVPKAVRQSENGSDSESFTEMLAIAGMTERYVESPQSASHIDLQAAALLVDQQREMTIVAQPVAVEPSLSPAIELAAQIAYLAPVASGPADAPARRADSAALQAAASQQPPPPGRVDSGNAQSMSVPAVVAAQSPQVASVMTEANPQLAMGRLDRPATTAASDRRAVIPSGHLLSSVRHETHLLVAETSTAEIRQLVLGGAKAESDAGSPGSGDTLPATAIAHMAKAGPAAGETEPVSVQIAGQVAAAWTSLRGALPVDIAESSAPAAAVSPLPDTAPDVVKALRFDLNPGELGEVHVRLSLSRNELRLHLSFSADRAAGMAHAEGQALLHELIEGGVNVGQIVIDSVSTARPESQVRQDAPAAQAAPSGEAMTDGGGAHPERHAQQETARRHTVREQSSEQPAMQSKEKTGIFI